MLCTDYNILPKALATGLEKVMEQSVTTCTVLVAGKSLKTFIKLQVFLGYCTVFYGWPLPKSNVNSCEKV